MKTEENEQILLRNSLRDHVRYCENIIKVLNDNLEFEVKEKTKIMRRANILEMEICRARLSRYTTRNMENQPYGWSSTTQGHNNESVVCI